MNARAVFALPLLLLVAVCFAVDNPESPDYVGEFRQRASVYEKRAGNAATTQAAVEIYANYEKFLDKELNSAYKLLLAKLPTAQQAQLKEAQRQWIKYRDAEFALIADNWTPENFGSSAFLSLGAYRTDVINNRVTQLLSYLKNY